MKKAITLLSEDKELEKFDQEFRALANRSNERYMFIRKQMSDLFEKFSTDRAEIWKKVEARLIERGFFDEKTDFSKVNLSIQDGVVYHISEDDRLELSSKVSFSIASLLKNLFKS